MKARISIAVLVLLFAAAAVFMRYGSSAKTVPTPAASTAAVTAQSAAPPAAQPALPQGPAPHLAVESKEHAFGTVKPGTPLRYAFVVKNDGPGVLEIQAVNPSCGCTTSSFDKSIAAGKTGTINLAIEKTDTYLGDIIKTATVVTNDPQNANFTLTLKANFAK